MRLSSMVGQVADWRWIIGCVAAGIVALSPVETQTAIANGDTRTISLYHAHTHESITATYLVNGQYDQAVLDKLNWFLRDWRNNETTRMDPRLFDTVWEVYRESGSQQPIEVLSAYRSPQTNAMLRRRSRGVAEHSQHILGKAMDQHYMDVPMSRIRELGMRLERGGVGFYPTAGTPFVHLDVGGVRHWPRMSYDQLARLFPDGKTVHIPSNGQPLPGYELARAELEARGDGFDYPTANQLKSKGFFAWLFGGGGSDEDDDNAQAGLRPSRSNQRVAALDRSRNGATQISSADSNAKDGGARGFFAVQPPRVAFPSRPEPQPQPQVAVAPPPAAAPQPQIQQPSPPQAAPQQALASAMVAAERAKAEAKNQPMPAEQPVLTRDQVGADLARSPLAPLPPRRPTELAALEESAPLPPPRPTNLNGSSPHDAVKPLAPGRADAIGALLARSRTAKLPDVITQGPGGSPRPSNQVLGYVAQPSLDETSSGSAVPMPVSRATALVSAHLDRSNFRNLTRPDTITRTTARSVLGSVVPAVRAAARSDLGALVPAPTARPSSFRAGGPNLTTDRFSGTAGKAGAQAHSASTDVD